MNTEEDYICFPGRVVKFYEEDQTADVLLCAEKVYSNADNNISLFKRGMLPRVPVHTPSGGGWSMTMPIKEGDTCILFFSQIGYDHWLYQDKDVGGTLVGNPVPHLLREFDENDGYALVGLNTLPRAIKDYHPENSEWRGPDSSLQVIRLKPDHHIEIESSVQVTVIAPHVQVNCNTMTADVTGHAQLNANTVQADIGQTLTANVGVSSTITSPTIDVTAAAAVTYTTPLFTINGMLAVSGAIGGGGAAPVTGTGITATGTSKITGTLEATSTVTASNVISGGKSVNGHTHAGDSGGTTGPF
jgi:phage gp45-like